MTPSFNPSRTKVRTPVSSDTLRTCLSTIFSDRFSDATSVGPIEPIKLAFIVGKRRRILQALFQGGSSSSFLGPAEFISLHLNFTTSSNFFRPPNREETEENEKNRADRSATILLPRVTRAFSGTYRANRRITRVRFHDSRREKKFEGRDRTERTDANDQVCVRVSLMVAIRASTNLYRVYREKDSRVVNLWSRGVRLRSGEGGERNAGANIE